MTPSIAERKRQHGWPFDTPASRRWTRAADMSAELARAEAVLTAASTALAAAEAELAASQATYDALPGPPATDVPPGAIGLYLRGTQAVQDRQALAISTLDLRRAQVADATRQLQRVTDAIALAGR